MMEITTTMVRFPFPKDGLVKHTDKAQLFLCRNGKTEDKVWVPFSKFEVTNDKTEQGMVEVAMAKWLFMKTSLPLFVKWEEFVVTSEVTNEQLNQQ